jgi:hypothetical protein
LPLGLSSAKDTAEKYFHGTAETVIDEKQDNKSQYEHPEKAHDHFQGVENKPQCQQTGEEGNDWVFK